MPDTGWVLDSDPDFLDGNVRIGTSELVNGRIGRTGKIAELAGLGGCWMGSFWVPKPLISEAWWLHLGTPGDHLGDPGVPGDTPEDTWGSISRFVLIFAGFRVSLGSHFALIFVTFS